jgi:hypothetical protein
MNEWLEKLQKMVFPGDLPCLSFDADGRSPIPGLCRACISRLPGERARGPWLAAELAADCRLV